MEHHHAMKNFQQNKAGREQNYIDGCTVYVYRVRPTMEYHSKTYRLDEEVVGAIERAKAGGTTPNRFLRELMGLNSENEEGLVVGEAQGTASPSVASPPPQYDPGTVSGVTRGVANLPSRPETSRERMARERAEKEARIRARSSMGDDPSFVADPEYAQD